MGQAPPLWGRKHAGGPHPSPGSGFREKELAPLQVLRPFPCPYLRKELPFPDGGAERRGKLYKTTVPRGAEEGRGWVSHPRPDHSPPLLQTSDLNLVDYGGGEHFGPLVRVTSKSGVLKDFGRVAKFVSFLSHDGVERATLRKRETFHSRPRGHSCLSGWVEGFSTAPSPTLWSPHGPYPPPSAEPSEVACSFPRFLRRHACSVPHGSNLHLPRSHPDSLPRPQPPSIPSRSRQAKCILPQAYWGTPGTRAGMAVPVVSGFCVKDANKAGDCKNGASILGVQTSLHSPRQSRYRHSGLGAHFRTPTQPSAIPRPACAVLHRAPNTPTSNPAPP